MSLTDSISQLFCFESQSFEYSEKKIFNNNIKTCSMFNFDAIEGKKKIIRIYWDKTINCNLPVHEHIQIGIGVKCDDMILWAI